MIILHNLDYLDAEQLRNAVRALAKEVHFKQATIDKLTHENAVLKKLKFASHSEAYTGEQKSLCIPVTLGASRYGERKCCPRAIV